ncbi:MAG: cytochrome c, partial [Flavobacteriaceae bacterium]|nr:cytochrome c [Flavobacteriaceae bacterium]
YNPEGATLQEMPDDGKETVVVQTGEKSLAEKIASGKSLYNKTCFACHQANGEGIPNAFPPLANSDYLNADVKRAISIIVNGKSGEIEVNGKTYNSVMTKQTLTDTEVADVLTYVYNTWGNNKTNVKVSTVQEVKSQH